MCWGGRDAGYLYVNQCNCFLPWVGGQEVSGLVVSLQGCGADWRGPAQPGRQQPLTPGGSCQQELMCDFLDANAIKTNIVARRFSSSLIAGAPPPCRGARGTREGGSSGKEQVCCLASLKARDQQLSWALRLMASGLSLAHLAVAPVSRLLQLRTILLRHR